jgi:hypothetical protein
VEWLKAKALSSSPSATKKKKKYLSKYIAEAAFEVSSRKRLAIVTNKSPNTSGPPKKPMLLTHITVM